MARNRRRWRYRDPAADRFAVPAGDNLHHRLNSTSNCLCIVFASFTTVLVVIKVVRNSASPPNEGGR